MIPLPNQRRKLRRSSLESLRRLRRNQRREFYVEILRLRQSGMSPRQIAPQIDVAVRTVERWLAAAVSPSFVVHLTGPNIRGLSRPGCSRIDNATVSPIL
jgi:transposase